MYAIAASSVICLSRFILLMNIVKLLVIARYQALLGNACLASSACRVQADLSVRRSSTRQAELGNEQYFFTEIC
ncbi:hypothetical protein [Beggiatoa leptomitoformis]|uniref:Uncharacterized protein n=1 Tax=Beggiatoa leptomitoformis TaxID=288004 RepID=A0A650GCV5_9GAMM|nr:hypothetical protein [Beggiatoa leptomitoformis]QGX03649.1 hypothetical protein AL038_18850 [Beggiatoa leptomitoformis]QGX04080.1 hypothetical protein BLE401_18600 [Beggiatoa leptomitoformis]